MREIVDAGALQAGLVEFGNRFSQLTPAIFERGRGSAHHGDEALEKLGNRLTRPARGHRDADTTGTMERGGTSGKLMVMGVEGQDGPYLA